MSLPKNCPTCGSDDPKRWDHANSIDPDGCANPWHEAWHQITERAEGPDLDDLVRLIRYLREHDEVDVQIGWPALSKMLAAGWIGRRHGQAHHWLVVEGRQDVYGAHFVGPDGTVYDNERNPL